MKDSDIAIFIEEMEEVGDLWTPEQVMETYGNISLTEALKTRKAEITAYFDILGQVINSNIGGFR